MEIKFDVYFKKNLGTLFKNNEVDLNGLPARTNLQLVLVDRLEINYKVGSNKYTDIVTITDATENLIQIPFKSDVVKVGLNEFEIVAYMKNGDIKTSQTYTYNIDEAIGEGKQTGAGGSSDGHTHNNLNVLNSITQSKVNEWNNKADANHTHSNYASSNHTHSNYASSNHTHNISEIVDLVLPTVPTKTSQLQNDSDFATNASVDEKIANVSTGGQIDLTSYAKKTDLPTKVSQLENDSNFISSIPEEYVTEQELAAKGLATETFVTSKINDLVLGPGNFICIEVDKDEIFEIDMNSSNLNTLILSVTNMSINEGSSKTFTVKLSEAISDNISVNITSDNSNISINPSELIFTSANYNAEQTVTVNALEDENINNETGIITLSGNNVNTKTINVSVLDNDKINVTGVSLNTNTLNVKVDEVVKLTATITPTNASNKGLQWSCSNQNARVDSEGNVTGVYEGEAIVTVTTIDGNYQDTCTVTIVAEQQVDPGSDITTDGLVTYFDARTISGTTWNDSVGNATATLSNFTNANGNGATGYSVNFRNGASKSKAGKITYSNINVDASNGMTIELVTNLHEYKSLWENFLNVPNVITFSKSDTIAILNATIHYNNTSDSVAPCYLNYLSNHLPENEVVHIFFVFDPQGTAKIYCNAVNKVISNSASNFKNWVSLNNITFSQQQTEQELYALRFYSKVLNEEEIAKNLSETLGGVE